MISQYIKDYFKMISNFVSTNQANLQILGLLGTMLGIFLGLNSDHYQSTLRYVNFSLSTIFLISFIGISINFIVNVIMINYSFEKSSEKDHSTLAFLIVGFLNTLILLLVIFADGSLTAFYYQNFSDLITELAPPLFKWGSLVFVVSSIVGLLIIKKTGKKSQSKK